jgi:selenocysteine-specific elongation factor
MSQPLTVGTAGHIDHGKTVLVRALTGVDTDRLPEERRRGISIVLGFAQLELPSGRALSVVDVPGHERFVRTMVAGATGIDIFLLVVAADDGVMPQTREHLAVLEALEIPAGVVALTKADAVAGDGLELARAEVAELLAGGRYEHSPVVPVSGVTGAGLDDLKTALDAVAATTPSRAERAGPARLHVDRSFTLQGIGTVVTGTLWSGELRTGMQATLQPSGRQTRIRSLQVHDAAVQRAAAGQRVAANLAGIERTEVRRGDVLTDAAALRSTYLVDASVWLREGLAPLRRGVRVHLHHGARESPARLVPLERDALEAGMPAFVQLRLERAIVAVAGDHLVLRQIAPPDTIGGGVVIDPDPRRHGPGEQYAQRLAALAGGDPLERLALALEEAPSGLVAEGADRARLERLAREGRAAPAGTSGTRWFSPGRLAVARTALADALDETGARPASRGALARRAGIDEQAAVDLLAELVADGHARTVGHGYVAARRPTDAEDALSARILEALATDGIEPRPVEALAAALGVTQPEVLAALERLAVEDGVVRVKPGLYYHQSGLEEARAQVLDICRRDGAVTIAGLRDTLGTSRKFAQALLEHFDSTRLTRRRGDEHVLR